jgi:hypothetical protein
LGNDKDSDDDQLSAVLGSGPSHGSIALNANGSFTYRPDDNLNGSDSFTYRASDGSQEVGFGRCHPDGHRAQRHPHGDGGRRRNVRQGRPLGHV